MNNRQRTTKSKQRTTDNGQRTLLPNGVVVLSEPMPHLRSTAVGIWLRAGSRHEPVHLNGISHFLEHMLFKGTEHRSARQIAIESDHLGGQVDAFTTRDCTGFHVQTLDTLLPEAFDLLADLTLHPVFDPVEFERERGVILEEMKMVEDTPDEMAFEQFTARFWPDHALGRPIEGTAATVQTFTPEILRTYFEGTYTADNLVVAAAGNLRHAQVVELTERHFGHLLKSTSPLIEAPPQPAVFIENIHKSCEQVHLVLGLDCPSLLSDQRYACSVLTTLLGGGLSSRLFQKIREEEGLAYNVYADTNLFRDAGCLNIYAALSPKNLRRALSLMLAEMAVMAREAVPEDELQRAKDQLLSGLVLGLESSSSRAGHLGRQEVLFQELTTLDEITRDIEAVTSDEVHQLAAEIFRAQALSCTVLGPLKRHKLSREMLQGLEIGKG